MKLKVLFKAFNVREAFMSGYRPDWCSPRKLEYNCAQLIFTDKQHINPGEEHQCILQPFIPEFWAGKVAINDVLRCMEGPRQVGEAIVQEIIQDITDVSSMCCDIPRGDDHNFCPNCGKEWEPQKRVVGQCCYHCGRVVGDHAVAMNKLWCKPPFDTSYKPLSKENK